MTPAVIETSPRILMGIGLAVLGFSFFSVQDATVKWLATTYPILQLLCIRSTLIVLGILAVGGRKVVAESIASPNKGAFAVRAILILVAWLCYYTASRSLGLAELTTLYFAAPIIVVILSVFVLKETVGPARWIAVCIGFGGVIVAVGPSGAMPIEPAMLTLVAAAIWAVTAVLVRMTSRTDKPRTQVAVSNLITAALCALPLPWIWVTPTGFDLVLIFGLGLIGGAGQFAYFASFRLAPASALAPFEYSALIWAFLWGYLIWGAIPAVVVFVGAGLIMASGLALVLVERRRAAV